MRMNRRTFIRNGFLVGGLAVPVAGWGVSDVPAAGAESAPSAPLRSVVYEVQDPAATTHFVPNPEVVRRLVDRGIAALAGKASASEGWPELIRSTETVGFKVTSAPGEVSGTRLPVVRALVESLRASGHPADRIAFWDKRSTDLRNAGWYRLAEELGVRCLASDQAGWDPDPDKAYDKAVLGRLVAGDLEYGRKEEPGVGRRSYVSRLLTHDLDRIIPVTPVMNHNVAGVNGQLLGLAFAGVDNSIRFANNPGLYAEAVSEICALEDIFPRIAFGVSDALVCQYRGEEATRLHNATMLNSLRFSRDPVALDVLAIADIENARGKAPGEGGPRTRSEIYSNAELLELGVADLKRIDVKRVDP